MFTVVVYGLIAVAVAAALIALLVLVLPEDRLNRPAADVVPAGLPLDREITAEDLTRMRIPVTVRGYRMVDTDAALDRLTAEIARRDEEIAQLRGSLESSSVGPSPLKADSSGAGSAGEGTRGVQDRRSEDGDRQADGADHSREDAAEEAQIAGEEAEEEAEAEAHPT